MREKKEKPIWKAKPFQATDEQSREYMEMKAKAGQVPMFTTRPADGKLSYTFFRAEEVIEWGTVRAFGTTIKNYKLK